MSPIRFYVDEDAAECAVVDALRARGIDALTTLEAHRTGASDEDQLGYAISQRRCLYTFNVRHFAKIHRDYLQQGRQHLGIVVIPEQRYPIGQKVRHLAQLVATVTAEEMVNRMEYL